MTPAQRPPPRSAPRPTSASPDRSPHDRQGSDNSDPPAGINHTRFNYTENVTVPQAPTRSEVCPQADPHRGRRGVPAVRWLLRPVGGGVGGCELSLGQCGGVDLLQQPFLRVVRLSTRPAVSGGRDGYPFTLPVVEGLLICPAFLGQ